MFGFGFIIISTGVKDSMLLVSIYPCVSLHESILALIDSVCEGICSSISVSNSISDSGIDEIFGIIALIADLTCS